MAPSPLHPSNAITEQPLGDNVDQVKQLLGALAAKGNILSMESSSQVFPRVSN